jgi:hypothetical protein
LVTIGLALLLASGCATTARQQAVFRAVPHSPFADIPTMLKRQARSLELLRAASSAPMRAGSSRTATGCSRWAPTSTSSTWVP